MGKNCYSCLLFLLSLMVMSSCKSFDNIELKGIDRVTFQGIENNIVHFSAGLQVYNPSRVNFKIKEVNLKTVANGDFLGTLYCRDDVKIVSRTDSLYMVPMNLKLTNIFTGASTLYKLSRLDKVKLEVKGYVKVRSFLITKKIDVAESHILDVPKFIN
jgi:hypothetical protein